MFIITLIPNIIFLYKIDLRMNTFLLASEKIFESDDENLIYASLEALSS